MTKLTTRKTVSPKHTTPKAPPIKLTKTQLIVLSRAGAKRFQHGKQNDPRPNVVVLL
jgi:hypothetical protein